MLPLLSIASGCALTKTCFIDVIRYGYDFKVKRDLMLGFQERVDETPVERKKMNALCE